MLCYVATAADRVQTGLDLVATNQDTIDTAADVVATGNDVDTTNADVVTTNADAATTTQDAIDTAADVVSTNADVATTTQDAIDTAADAVSTAADVVSTNADVVLTNADVTYAAEWANKAEDSLISAAAGGYEVDDYSALHWAKRAEYYATGALNYKGNHDASTTAYPVDPELGHFWKMLLPKQILLILIAQLMHAWILFKLFQQLGHLLMV